MGESQRRTSMAQHTLMLHHMPKLCLHDVIEVAPFSPVAPALKSPRQLEALKANPTPRQWETTRSKSPQKRIEVGQTTNRERSEKSGMDVDDVEAYMREVYSAAGCTKREFPKLRPDPEFVQQCAESESEEEELRGFPGPVGGPRGVNATAVAGKWVIPPPRVTKYGPALGKYGIHTFEKAVVRVSWVVPEIVNRPIVMYEIERATSGLDVYLEGACTIEELHYEKVGTADTADYNITVELINEKNEQLSELQEKMLGSPRSIKKAMEELHNPIDMEIGDMRDQLTDLLYVDDKEYDSLFGKPVVFRVRAKDQEEHYGPWVTEMCQLDKPEPDPEPIPEILQPEPEPEPEPEEVYQAPVLPTSWFSSTVGHSKGTGRNRSVAENENRRINAANAAGPTARVVGEIPSSSQWHGTKSMWFRGTPNKI